MINSDRPRLGDPPPVVSLDALYTIVIALGHNMIDVYQHLSAEMKSCRNDRAMKAFEDLEVMEVAQNNAICELARKAGVDTESKIDAIWLKPQLRGLGAREIADNPYLMTPYRALRLAVINKERVFEILSAVAASQSDNVIRQHAEALARAKLPEIAELRLRRRRAFRSEVKSAVQTANLGNLMIETDGLNKVIEIINTIICSTVSNILEAGDTKLSSKTEQVLQAILDSFQSPLEGKPKDQNRLGKSKVSTPVDGSLFPALKALMRELESATNLYLELAERENTEQGVNTAQIMAEKCVFQLSNIRDALNLMR